MSSEQQQQQQQCSSSSRGNKQSRIKQQASFYYWVTELLDIVYEILRYKSLTERVRKGMGKACHFWIVAIERSRSEEERWRNAVVLEDELRALPGQEPCCRTVDQGYVLVICGLG